MLPFLPESPYFLVMKGRLEKAQNSLAQLGNKPSQVMPHLDQIVRVSEEERARSVAAEGANFLECFRGVNLRRTRLF